jgi:capsule polysaccharide export protein KpsC/LpsZ
MNTAVRKLRKLILHPRAFFEDRRTNLELKREVAGKSGTYFAFNIADWKRDFLQRCYPQQKFVFISLKDQLNRHHKRIERSLRPAFLVWGNSMPEGLENYATSRSIPIVRMEDGFVRSVGLGSQHLLPYSLCTDRNALYFDARTPSELEILLQTHDFAADAQLMQEARECLALIRRHKITKYNLPQTALADTLYGPKTKKRILVIGQVEDDQSVILGCDRPINNNDLVRLAAEENPEAQIIYKMHPDVIAAKRKELSDPNEVAKIAVLVRQPMSLDDALYGVDRVYTISSLAGLESLIREIPVTTVGCPFYAGWGLTETHQAHPRRTRTLSLEELFAGSYLLYAKYFDPDTALPTTLRQVIARISASQPQVVRESATANTRKPVQKRATVDMRKPVQRQPSQAGPIKTSSAPPGSIPAWFRAQPGPEMTASLDSGLPVFLHVPWIAEHGNALISKIHLKKTFRLAPFDLVDGISSNDVRRDVLKFAREHPDVYRKMVARRLVPLRNRIAGVVFTFDWAPVMRVIASVCEELEIPRILIPHESVFVDREKYYWDPTALASTPTADIILGWGELQKEIFVERGYPADRFVSVGAPKFDSYFDYHPQLSREQFCRLFGLSAEKKIVLFASQPLDSQLDQKLARQSQRQAIQDLLDFSEADDYQLLVRLPPSKEDILGINLRSQINASGSAAVDEATCYLVPPEEAIFHAGLVTSVNSTMLFEALLLERSALSLKYIEFDQIWAQLGIPAVHSKTALHYELQRLLNQEFSTCQQGMARAARMFGVGQFDGQASARIQNILEEIAISGIKNGMRSSALTRVLAGERIDVLGTTASNAVVNTSQRYLTQMMGARTRVISVGASAKFQTLASVDLFVQWGITQKKEKNEQLGIAKTLAKPIIFIEDGFIRSVDIGLSGEPGLSIILDDTTAYYDATRPSRLQRLLQNGKELTSDEFQRSREAIAKIVHTRISKYNHAPNISLKIGTPGKRKVLLVDQRFGDQSVISGLADESSYERMLLDVIRLRADCDIIIKQHPDAIKGGKSSYYSDSRLAFTRYMDNIFLVNFDINPFALFELVDEVYVVTSGMGFEALMAGKTVHCYGVPFYAGWGVTTDKISVPGRNRPRSVEEIFHLAYIDSSRYFHPIRNEVVQVEELIDYIVSVRKW